MTEERKYAILFAATVLCARKLQQPECQRPSPARMATVENAIRDAEFILQRIDQRWPAK